MIIVVDVFAISIILLSSYFIFISSSEREPRTRRQHRLYQPEAAGEVVVGEVGFSRPFAPHVCDDGGLDEAEGALRLVLPANEGRVVAGVGQKADHEFPVFGSAF